jgi:colanic acid biosynthesis glycosyl transferase WcaI
LINRLIDKKIMHLLIIGLNFAPELTGIGKYTGEMAAWFAARGHRITVITSPPYYPSWQVMPEYRSWAWQSESWEGCSIIRCPLYVPHSVTGLRRVAHLGSFALASALPALYQAMHSNPDIVLAVAPALLAAPIALMAGRLASSKTWLHVQDLEIEAAFELGILKSRRMRDRVLAGERRLLGKFDLVSSISPKMLDAIRQKGVSNERLMLLPNWVDTRRVLSPRSQFCRRQFGIRDDQCVALYSGSMGQKHGLEVIIAAARQISPSRDDSILFALAGDGPARPALEAEAKGLSNIVFLPVQPEERFYELLNAADIHLLPQRLDAADLVMPSKLGAIFASGKPVIATVLPKSQIAIAIADAGVIVPPDNPKALAAAVRDLANAPDRRSLMGRRALGIATTWDTHTVLNDMEECLLALCGSSFIRATSNIASTAFRHN